MAQKDDYKKRQEIFHLVIWDMDAQMILSPEGHGRRNGYSFTDRHLAGFVAHSYTKEYEKVRKSANQRRTGNYE